MISPHLKALGFSDKEIAVLSSIIVHGVSTPIEISERCELARSTVYMLLEELAARGLVKAETTEVTGAAGYSIAGASAFVEMVAKEKEAVLKRERVVESFSELLAGSGPDAMLGVPKIIFRSGKKGIESLLFEHRQKWRDSMAATDFTWWGYQDDTFVSQYRNWFEDTWRTTAPNERVSLLTNRSPLEDELKNKVPLRDLRQIAGDDLFSSTIWICGEYVVMITTRHKPHYAFELHDKIFAENLKLVFRQLWLANNPPS